MKRDMWVPFTDAGSATVMENVATVATGLPWASTVMG
jgi:hypothetical protein